jgi:hypothetical protein
MRASRVINLVNYIYCSMIRPEWVVSAHNDVSNLAKNELTAKVRGQLLPSILRGHNIRLAKMSHSFSAYRSIVIFKLNTSPSSIESNVRKILSIQGLIMEYLVCSGKEIQSSPIEVLKW